VAEHDDAPPAAINGCRQVLDRALPSTTYVLCAS
jgi:hypothetical protein